MQETKQSTFVVRITQSENASWQGQVTWADKNITKNFRSALELIKLIDSVVRTEEENFLQNNNAFYNTKAVIV